MLCRCARGGRRRNGFYYLTTLDGKQTTALNIFWEPEDTISFMEEALVGNVLMRFAFLMILLPIFDLF